MAANNTFCLKLQNFQKVNNVSKIFSKNKNISELKPPAGENPVLVIVVGAPGVGKTTKTRKILGEMDLNYNNFYNVSLDSLVEKIRPYRNTSKNLHNKLQTRIAALPNENKSQFNNSAAALLSDLYLQTIMSKNTSFSLPRTKRGIEKKIGVFGDPVSKATFNAKKVLLAQIAKQSKATQKKVKGKANAKENNEEGEEEEEESLICLNDMLKKGIEFGIQNGLNIIYDTTITQDKTNKNKIQKEIMPMLERHTTYKYSIIVILVTADETVIKERIRGRHSAMLAENVPYIRAINPHLTKKFIEDNKIAFNETEKYFTNFSNYATKHPDTQYRKEHFKFVEAPNPPNSNYNKNNNNYRRTFKRLFGNSNNF